MNNIVEYFNRNLWRTRDGYMQNFKQEINKGNLTIDNMIDLGKYFIKNFDYLMKNDGDFELYYRNFNVFVRDYICLSDKIFMREYENTQKILKVNSIILKDLKPILS